MALVLKCVIGAFLVSPCVAIQAVAIDGASAMQEVAASPSKHIRSEVAPQALLQTDTCQVLVDRVFEFKDNVCGSEKYKIPEMLTAFHVEQAYWAGQGLQNPWWAVDTAFPRGKEYPIDKKLSFYEHGVATLSKMLPKAQALGLLKEDWIKGATALDFGCGLGRMSNALASAGFKKVKCLDQAQTFLDAGKESLTKLAGQGVVPTDVASKVDFVKSAPDLLCVQPLASIDFVHSVITLQHMKPMLQVSYIEQLCDVLRSGGAGYFQIPTFIYNTPKDTHCSLSSESNTMMMHYTPKEEVERHLSSRGCKVLSATDYDMIGTVGKSMLFIFEKQ